MLIFEEPTITVKYITAIKALFLCFNLYLSVMLDSLSHSYPFLLNIHVALTILHDVYPL